MKRLFTVAAMGLVSLTVFDAEQHQLSAQPKSAPIHLSGCRIQLKHRTTLAAERVGVIGSTMPEEGDFVKESQLVTSLKAEAAHVALEIAEKEASNDVEIRYAEKAAEVATVEYQKARDANRQFPGTIPDIEVRRLLLAAQRARLQIEQAEFRFAVALLTVKQARAELKSFQIFASFDGIVTRVYKSKGEAVRQGDPIMDIINTQLMKVEGRLSLKDHRRVKRGAYVQVRLDIPDEDHPDENVLFEGRIVFVDQTVQPVTGKARVVAEVVNRNNLLKAGLSARMIIDPNRNVSPKTALRNNSVRRFDR